MARTTIAQLERDNARLQAIIDTVAEKVMGYDGCYPGRVEFLQECGIAVKPPVDVVEFTVAFHIDPESEHVGDPDSLADALQDALDSASFVKSRSTYVTDVASYGKGIQSSNLAISLPDSWEEV